MIDSIVEISIFILGCLLLIYSLTKSFLFLRQITDHIQKKKWAIKLMLLFIFFISFSSILQLRYTHNDGHLHILFDITLLFSATYILFSEDFFTKILVENQNQSLAITLEKRQKEHYLRNILDHLPMLISYVDLNQCYTFQNSAHEQWTGKKPHLLIGKSVRRVIGEKNFQLIVDSLIQALNGRTLSTEVDLIDPSGNIRYMILDFIPDFNDLGHTKGCFFVMTDLTEKRRLVENLSIATSQVEDKRKLEFVLDQTGEGIIHFNQRGEIAKINKAMESIFEFSAKELIGHHISKIIPLERSNDNQPLDIESLFLAHRGKRREMVGITKNGKKIHIDIAVCKIHSDTKSNFMGLILDISRRKETENELKKARELAEQATKIKSDVLANVSHEIRTPLGGILGIAELLQDQLHGKDGSKEIETILDCGNTLMGMLNDVLDFSKLESHKVEAEHLPTNLYDLVNQCTYLMDAKATVVNTRIFTDIGPEVPNWVATDTTKLRQIILNLLGNAIKFTKNGTITVSVRATSPNIDNVLSIAFSITDTGIGISSQQISKLFQEFSQAEASTSRQYGGTGLGLAICKGLVNLLGGQIGVHSKEKVGSTFYFNILCKKIEPPKEISNKKKTFAPLSFERALIADDNSVNRKVLGAFLNHFGVHFDEVSSGQEALVALKKNHYDFVLMDCFMPETDGYQTSQEIRQNADYDDLIIIAVTGITQPQEIKKCYASGMNHYLAKPISKEKLYDLLAMIDPKKKASND